MLKEDKFVRPDIEREKIKELIEYAKARDGISDTMKWADHWGVSRGGLTYLMYGRQRKDGTIVKPNLDTLDALASALRLPLPELVLMVIPDAYGAHEASESGPMCRVLVEVVGWRDEDPSPLDANEGYIYIDKSIVAKRRTRAFRVRGDAMDSGRFAIQAGDIVLVDLNDHGENATTVVARIFEPEGYVIKLLKDNKFGYSLHSRNAEYTNGTPVVVPRSNIAEMIGRVYFVLKDFQG